MPPIRDVILGAYACSPQAPCSFWARTFFKNEPIVLSVQGSSATMLRKGRQWSASGDAFRAALDELEPQYRNVEIGRRALIVFASGWHLAHNILIEPREQGLLDTLFLQDGLHSMDVTHWVDFARRAALREALMVMAHTRITPPFTSSNSTRKTNSEVFRRAVGGIPDDGALLPEPLLHPEFPSDGISISVDSVRDERGKVIMPAQTKLWEADCMAHWEGLGTLFRVEYEGVDRPDQAYISQAVGPRLWRTLADRWNV
jgi:hypothetical protein